MKTLPRRFPLEFEGRVILLNRQSYQWNPTGLYILSLHERLPQYVPYGSSLRDAVVKHPKNAPATFALSGLLQHNHFGSCKRRAYLINKILRIRYRLAQHLTKSISKTTTSQLYKLWFPYA